MVETVGPVYDSGDMILCRGEYVEVIDVLWHEPHTHDFSPIRNTLRCEEVVTDRGSRYFGFTS